MTPRTEPLASRPLPERRGCLRKAFAAAGLTLALLWLAFFVFWLRTPAFVPLRPPPLPSPNGYDDVLNAGKSIQSKPPMNGAKLPDFDNLDTPALRAFVEAHRDDLALIRLGLGRPFQVPVSYESIAAMLATTNESSLLRTVSARTLYAEGVLARREGRAGDALRSSFDLLGLGDAMSRKVPMISYLGSFAPQYLGLASLRDLRADLDKDQLRGAVARLRALDLGREPVDEVIGRELAFMDQNLRKMGTWVTVVYTTGGTLKAERARGAAQILEADRQASVRLRILLADLAVRQYFKEQGAYPASLDAIAPALPADPYSPSGLPLVYRKTGGAYRLYSVGPDGRDDRLDPVLGRRHGTTSRGDFTLDSF